LLLLLLLLYLGTSQIGVNSSHFDGILGAV